jgi:hypothetical protein
MEQNAPNKPLPTERVVPTDLRPIYVTGATGELTPSYGMIQFHVDRPIFRLVENKSVVEKIRRDVVSEVHMAFEVWKSIGAFMSRKAELTEVPTRIPMQGKLEQKQEWLRKLDASHNKSRAMRILEMEDPNLVGKGYPPPLSPDKMSSETRTKYFNLEKSMTRIWNEARMSYLYGFFQSCTFQVGAVLELLIEQFLRIQGRWTDYESEYTPKRRWLGTLIEFCEDQKLLTESILKDAYDINDLRITAVHMETEKREGMTPPDDHPLIELEDATVFESTGEETSIHGDAIPGQGVIFDLSNPKRPMIKREAMYKPQAAKAFRLLANVFWAIREQ